jgi:hypothetical protein
VSENLGLPEDITSLSVDELNQFETDAMARFTVLFNSGTTEITAVQNELAEMSTLTAGIERAKAEVKSRAEAAIQAEKDAADQAAAIETQRAELAAKHAEFAAQAAAAAKPVTASVQVTERAPRKLNPSLADAQAQAPKVILPRQESVLVASADVPGFTSGGRLGDMDELVKAVTARARNLAVTAKGDEAPRYTVASLMREHKFNLGLDSTPLQVNEVLTAATNPDILVAAGGWCSPSEISYDFYNIVCEDGMLDIPTVGINRGGIRFPTSPSFADVTASTALWRWTETQDIAAATGTAQSGTKTCGRVPCPDFNEERLACDGICLTVGNLTQDAYPEVIANFTRLLFAAHAHKVNRLRIDQLRGFANAPAVTGTFGAAGEGLVAPVVNAIALNAQDYRSRYAMCENAVLEVLAPKWLRSAMRSDLRRRTGAPTDQLAMTDAALMRLFDAENVRVQFVSDYQERTVGYPGYFVSSATPLAFTSWPSTIEFLMWAPGTVVLGQGMRLDLGIIRDSVLNATNDFTAEWMEECWLMFKPGHEVRKIVVNICADGTTGAHDLTSCQ